MRVLSGVYDGVTLGTPISLSVDQRGHALRRLPRDEGEIPPEPRRLHLRREIRRPRLARRRSDQRARNGRPRRGRRHCEKTPRGSPRRGDRGLGVERRPDHGQLRCRDRHARAGRPDAGALPGSGARRRDDRSDRSDPKRRQFARRDRDLRRARLPARLGRAGVRSARSRSRQSDAEPAGEQRAWRSARASRARS